jgi:sulfur-carrier protein
MEVSIRLAKALSNLTDGKNVIECSLDDGIDLAALIQTLDGQYPGLKEALCSAGSAIRDSINIYVNGDNVRYIDGLKTALHKGDEVNIVPAAVAG